MIVRWYSSRVPPADRIGRHQRLDPAPHRLSDD
jgi:hypothetical protein